MDDACGTTLASLDVAHLRNCRRLNLETDAPVVVLSGRNGAGKTTLLEAIYLLARGRSFRGRKAGPLTTTGEHVTLVRGRMAKAGGRGQTILYRSDPRGREHTTDGLPCGGEGAGPVPLSVRLIGENAQSLLEGDPGLRRTFLDWNVFHVEHRLGGLRKDLRRVLMQRNAAIRAGADRSIWDRPLISLTEAIDGLRQSFFRSWRTEFLRLATAFPFLADCDLRLQRGWREDLTFPEALLEARSAESARGFTLIGPSRADFAIVRGKGPATLSRGQSKVAVSLLQLAAEWVHRAHTLTPAVWLIDDLEAELDRETADRLWEFFVDTKAQRFVTRVASTPGSGLCGESESTLLFHVEHATPVHAGRR